MFLVFIHPRTRYVVVVKNVFYYAVACQIANFVNSASVSKVLNAEIWETNKVKLLCWKEL